MTKLFVVDDDPIFHYIIRAQLRWVTEFEVSRYDDVQSFVNFLSQNQQNDSNLPDILLLDLNLGDGSGWRILDLISESYHSADQQLVVFVVSASVNPADQLRAFTYRFVQDFLIKPLPVNFFTSLFTRYPDLQRCEQYFT